MTAPPRPAPAPARPGPPATSLPAPRHAAAIAEPAKGKLRRSRAGSRLRRLGAQRGTTPGRLRLLLAGLLALGLLTGAVAAVTAASAGSATGRLRDTAQPLLLEAETVFSALADADATAAQAFLTGGLEPADLTQRFDDDLERAATALTSAARRTPAEGEAGAAIQTLNTGLSRYAGLVATARANNRQGLPVGASFLASASQLNREQLQPQAEQLLRLAQREVADGYGDATAPGWSRVLTVLLVVLLAALVAGQIHVSRISRRTFNVPLVAATGVTLLLAATMAGVFTLQRDRLTGTAADGSRPIALLAEARLLALRERGDEALTLVSRSGGTGQYETDFDTAAARLREVLADAAAATRGTSAAQMVETARDRHTAYTTAHAQVRKLDKDGSYDEAVSLAIGKGTTSTFSAVTGSLDSALDDRREAFAGQIASAGRGLGVLTVLAPLLALVLCVLAALGIRARLEEYR
ncbi:hypothetical protein [Actinoplanes sp. RD1]|uniref:hypothetical protein n=1 Tax=Actinoplanes sp. RD1 TaxID=3064538 RepID=UPI00274192FA|nr:hypothetical protein [Actinoplanes sp. RD1]